MFTAKNLPPEILAKMEMMSIEMAAECIAMAEKRLNGQMRLVAVSVYYGAMVRLLLGMADDLELILGCTPEQTVENIVDFIRNGLNSILDDMRMSEKANVTQEGRA